jgi:plastocyanin
MKPAWTQIVGPPTSVGGIVGSTAYANGAVYGPITAAGYLWSVDTKAQGLRWISPVGDGAHWGPPVAVSHGVVYTVDLTGFLDAFDARTGAPLLKRPMLLGGTNTPASLSWGGVSVARDTVYAAVGITGLPDGFVVAYRPGGPADVVGDLGDTAGGLIGGGGGSPGGGGSGGSPGVVAGPGATNTGYLTPAVTTNAGADLSFTNADIVQHDVVSDDKVNGETLFRSDRAGLGETVPIEGVERLHPGESYGFYCSIHRGMRGTLIVR